MVLVIEEMEVRVVKVNVPESIVKRRDEMRSQGLCLGCETKPEAGKMIRRGLCPACYQAMLRALRNRATTKTELIREGRMLDRGVGGRPTTNKFTRSLSGR